MRAPGRRAAVVAVLTVLAATFAAACGGDGGFVLPTPTLATTSTAVPRPTAPATTTTLALDRMSWRARAAAPAARQEVASAVVDGKVWVVGGIDAAGGARAAVESYDPATDRWAPGPDLPVAVHHPAAVAYRGEVVVAGGFLAGPDLYSRPTDRVFALRSGAWVELPRLRRARGAAAAAVVADRIVLVGGRNASALIGPSELFDGNAWQDRAPIPTLRDHLAADADSRALYAVGGRLISPGRTTPVLERYDPVADVWEALAPMPTARGGHGAVILAGRLIAAGGEDAVSVFPHVEAFDIEAGAWTALASMPEPRHGLALGTVGAALYALVGGDAAGVAASRVTSALL